MVICGETVSLQNAESTTAQPMRLIMKKIYSVDHVVPFVRCCLLSKKSKEMQVEIFILSQTFSPCKSCCLENYTLNVGYRINCVSSTSKAICLILGDRIFFIYNIENT